MKLFTLLTILSFSTQMVAYDSYFHSVKAKSGDGIFSLLRRYDLNANQCNREQFLTLNKLDIKDELINGQSYKLPIIIYKYDGKSIRSTLDIADYDKALRIQKYNEALLADKLRKTRFQDSKVLWVPYSELHCNDAEKVVKSSSEPTPVATTKKVELSIPLFGDDNKTVAVDDHSLKGRVYYLVSGHGGPDPGAMCTKTCSNELCEDEYAYDVCLRLYRELVSHGATVHMIIQDKNDGIREEAYLTCDKDETCMGSRIHAKQKPRLSQRASAINELYRKYKKQGVKDQIALMVHVDSNTKEKRQDVYFYHHKTSRTSKSLSQNLQSTFKAKYEKYRKGRAYKGYVRPRGLYMLNNTLPTSAYVELANIRNPNDQQRIIKSSNMELLAQWLYEGIIKYQKVDLPHSSNES